MNDRFKFRVWDKINGIWVKNFSIDEQGYVEGFYNPPQANNRRPRALWQDLTEEERKQIKEILE